MPTPDIPQPGNFFEAYKQLDIQSTLDFMAAELEATVYLEDTEGNLLFVSANPREDHWRSDFSLFAAPNPEMTASTLESWATELRIYSSMSLDAPGPELHMVLANSFRGRPFAFVHVVSMSNPDLAELFSTHSFIKEVGDKIYIVMIGELYDTTSHSLSMGDLIHELELRQRTHPEDSDPAYVVLAVDLHRYAQLHTESYPWDRQALGTRAGNQLVFKSAAATGADRDTPAKHLPGYGVFIDGNRLGIVVALGPATGFADRLAVQQQLDTVLGNDTAFKYTNVAVSSVFTRPRQLAEHYDQATRVLELGKRQLPHVRVYSSAGIGLHELLMPVFADPDVKEYARKVLAPLKDNPELEETLAVFLQENSNAARTAERLYLTRRSVTYRLERIRKSLGMDLSNSETVFLLHFCLRVEGRM